MVDDSLSKLIMNITGRGLVLLKIETKEHVVLCGLPENEATPFVIWRYNEEGDTFHGNYFFNRESAERGFDHRTKQYV